jgi:four helix bundle protein
MQSQHFTDLNVWKKAHQLVLELYPFTAGFPPDERFGLTMQLRRAAIAIPSNIAAGFKRERGPDKLRNFNTALASLEECRYFLILAKDLQLGTRPDLETLAEEVSKMLSSYKRSIEGSGNG